jgi:hypothetical protein
MLRTAQLSEGAFDIRSTEPPHTTRREAAARPVVGDRRSVLGRHLVHDDFPDCAAARSGRWIVACLQMSAESLEEDELAAERPRVLVGGDVAAAAG